MRILLVLAATLLCGAPALVLAASVEITVAAEGTRPAPGGVATLGEALAEARRRRARDRGAASSSRSVPASIASRTACVSAARTAAAPPRP